MKFIIIFYEIHKLRKVQKVAIKAKIFAQFNNIHSMVEAVMQQEPQMHQQ